MILITKEEYAKLKEYFGEYMPHVAITNRHKNGARKKRYIEESRKVLKILKEIREADNKEGVT